MGFTIHSGRSCSGERFNQRLLQLTATLERSSYVICQSQIPTFQTMHIAKLNYQLRDQMVVQASIEDSFPLMR
jgi:hypothetical protein